MEDKMVEQKRDKAEDKAGYNIGARTKDNFCTKIGDIFIAKMGARTGAKLGAIMGAQMGIKIGTKIGNTN